MGRGRSLVAAHRHSPTLRRVRRPAPFANQPGIAFPLSARGRTPFRIPPFGRRRRARRLRRTADRRGDVPPVSRNGRCRPRDDRMNQVDPDVVFSKRTAAVVVGLGVASFIAMLILMARGEPNRKILTADPSVFSESSLGHRAAFEFLRESGLSVKTRRNRRSLAADSRTAVVAAEPKRSAEKKSILEEGDEDAFNPETELYQLADQAYGLGAPFVLVLPKWKGDRARTADGLWIKNASLEPASQVIKP